MLAKNVFVRGTLVLALMLAFIPRARADELRNVHKGEPVPAYRLPALDGAVVDSEALRGQVVVLVCLSAEQRRSELAAIESSEVVPQLAGDRARLVHVTADVIQRSYFEGFRAERGITVPLVFDSDRAFYGKLGLIVLPTTIIVDAEGRLAHVISLHSAKYEHELGSYLRHALGETTDAELEAALAAGASSGSAQNLASAHRALARSLREKGMLEGAKAELLKARAQAPDDHEVILDLADLDLAMRNLDEAENSVGLVLSTQPNHRRAKQLQGIIAYLRGDDGEAERVLTEALNLNPNPELSHYYLGRICEKQGRTDEALAHYREALRHLLDAAE